MVCGDPVPGAVSSVDVIGVLRGWTARQWVTACVAALSGVAFVAVTTGMISNPIFSRPIAPSWWTWPALIASAVLGGLLVGTYVRVGVGDTEGAAEVEDADGVGQSDVSVDRPARRGVVGGVLTFFAVGCPICNKLVLVAIGSAGAMTWFRPFQPVLQVAALALLVWALRTRLVNAESCVVPPVRVGV